MKYITVEKRSKYNVVEFIKYLEVTQKTFKNCPTSCVEWWRTNPWNKSFGQGTVNEIDKYANPNIYHRVLPTQ